MKFAKRQPWLLQAHFIQQLDELLESISAKQRDFDQVKADLNGCQAESGRVSQALSTADRQLQVVLCNKTSALACHSIPRRLLIRQQGILAARPSMAAYIVTLCTSCDYAKIACNQCVRPALFDHCTSLQSHWPLQ